MIESLSINRQLPPYIPPRSFALSILALVTGSNSEDVLRNIRQTLYNLPEDGGTGNLKRVLLILSDEAHGDPGRLRAGLEVWFTSTMDGVAGLYKRVIQWTIFFTALIVTLLANVSTLTLARYISETPMRRDLLTQQMVELAGRRYASAVPVPSPTATPFPNYPSSTASPTPAPSPTPVLEFDDPMSSFNTRLALERVIESGRLPIGWNDLRSPWNQGPLQLMNLIVGWLITAFAVTLCALFWFDVLNKFIVVRTAIKPPEERSSRSIDDRYDPPT